MKLGWIHEQAQYLGGAEMNRKFIREAKPDWVEITNDDPDAWVVFNITPYKADLIDKIKDKPVIKYVPDRWPQGDPQLRSWFMRNSRLMILVSPLLLDWLPEQPQCPIGFAPSGVDIEKFRRAQQLEREGAVWLGRMWAGKGLENARAWEEQTGESLDYYGFGPLNSEIENYKGEVAPEDVPAILGRYQKFVHLPNEPDACPRTVIEAWAAGCQLVVNRNVGTVWWLKNEKDALEHATERFWHLVELAL